MGNRTLSAALASGLIFGASTLAVFSQAVDTEPNDTCATAQDLGIAGDFITVTGSLDSLPDAPDVDFFKLLAAPYSEIVIDLEGEPTGAGTLGDPFVGAFDGGCDVIRVDDDGGEGVNARLSLTVPDDGNVVVAATHCCDRAFVGGGEGSYRLSVLPVVIASSVRGRIVDAATGDPPGGSTYDFRVELRRCTGGGRCSTFLSTSPDSDGDFVFANEDGRTLLLAGTYVVHVVHTSSYGRRYQAAETPPFTLRKGEDADVGTIALAPQPSARSIGGRVLDARTGAPVGAGTQVSVELRRCSGSGGDCYESVRSTTASRDGRFLLTTDGSNNPLWVGTYELRLSANDYVSPPAVRFTVAADEAHDLGDLTLDPVPLVGSISAQVLDAATNMPLTGAESPFVVVELRSCYSGASSCYSTAATQAPDGNGRVRFETDGNGRPLVAQSYALYVTAEQYESTQTAAFETAEGEDFDVGPVALPSYPVRFSEIRTCGDLPPEGGDCTYSVRVSNGQAKTYSGSVWSLVSVRASSWGSTATQFQAGLAQAVSLGKGASKLLVFRVRVPSKLASGSQVCATVYAGQGADPFFEPLGQRDLFCVTKRDGRSGFAVMEPAAARDAFRRIDGLAPLVTPAP